LPDPVLARGRCQPVAQRLLPGAAAGAAWQLSGPLRRSRSLDRSLSRTCNVKRRPWSSFWQPVLTA